jgi:hypothetical protein
MVAMFAINVNGVYLAAQVTLVGATFSSFLI